MSHSIETVREELGDYTLLLSGGYTGGTYQVCFAVWLDGVCKHYQHRTFRREAEMLTSWEWFKLDLNNGYIKL